VTQSADDLKARDMVLCRFPEVDMVVGKAGRAETPTDPAPMDMIETMVNFRPREFWPKRKLRAADTERQAAEVLDALVARGIVARPSDAAARATLIEEAASAALPRFDAQMREYAYQRNQEFARSLGDLPTASLLDPHDALDGRQRALWRQHVGTLDGELLDRAAGTYTRLVMDELLHRSTIADPEVASALEARERASEKLRAAGARRSGHQRGRPRPK
jgi:Cu(I)/Ag(I) efflux system membrane protein CusA/SilA